ncbi:MAG: ubiquinol-cytochrome c reductase iron-sulfur subunit, partial [Nitrospirales bacterium]
MRTEPSPCSHLGCGYHWDTTDRRFKCPSHGSVYDVTGEVLTGPAPSALDRLPTKIEKEGCSSCTKSLSQDRRCQMSVKV